MRAVRLVRSATASARATADTTKKLRCNYQQLWTNLPFCSMDTLTSRIGCRHCSTTSSSSSSSDPPTSTESHSSTTHIPFEQIIREWDQLNAHGLKLLEKGDLHEAESFFIHAMRRVNSPLLSSLPKGKFNAHITASHLTLVNLATVQRLRGQLDGARGNLRQALDILKSHPNIDGGDRVFGRIYREMGLCSELDEDYSTAKSWYEQSTQSYRQARLSSKDLDPYVATNAGYEEAGALYALATMQVKSNELTDAATSFLECFQRTKESFGADSFNTAECAVEYGRLLIQLKRKEEAQQNLMTALEIYSAHKDPRLNVVLPIYLSTMDEMAGILDEILNSQSVSPSTEDKKHNNS